MVATMYLGLKLVGRWSLGIGGWGWHLDAVVAVGKVIHGLVLFVDDPDASFVGADGDGFDIFGGFASPQQFFVDVFCSFDGGLRVEFS